MINIEKLYYGVMNYKDSKGELRIYASNFSNDLAFAAYALNKKIKESNIEFVSCYFNSFYRELDYFEKLENQNIVINKKYLNKSDPNENFDDEDNIVLTQAIYDIKQGSEIKYKEDFETLEDFSDYLNKNAILDLKPLDRNTLIENISLIDPISLQPVMIIDSLNFEKEIDSFKNSEDYAFFEVQINDFLNNEEKYKSDFLFFGQIYTPEKLIMTALTDDPTHAALLTEELINENNLKEPIINIDYIPFYNYSFEHGKEEGKLYKKCDYIIDSNNETNGEYFVDNDEDCLLVLKKLSIEDVTEQNPEISIEKFNDIKDGYVLDVEQFDPMFEDIYDEHDEIVPFKRLYSEPIEYDLMIFETTPEFEKYKENIENILEEIDESEYNDDIVIKDSVKERLHNTWNNQIELLHMISERNDVQITLCHLSSGVVGAFNEENMEYLFNFINDGITESENLDKLNELAFSVVVRQFTDKKSKTGGKIKNVSTCLINHYGIFPFSKKDTMDVCLTDHETGHKLKKEKDVVYMSFNSLLDSIDISLEEEKQTLH